MSDRRARLAFMVAAGVVTGAVLALTLLPGDAKRPPGERTHPSPGRIRVAEAASHQPREKPPTRRPKDQHAARRVALRFLRAFLRYEAGDTRPDVARELVRTATPHLARGLRAPVRLGAAVPPGRVSSLAVYGPVRGKLKASALVDRARLGRTLVELGLAQHGGRWLVGSLSP